MPKPRPDIGTIAQRATVTGLLGLGVSMKGYHKSGKISYVCEDCLTDSPLSLYIVAIRYGAYGSQQLYISQEEEQEQ